MHNLPVRFGTLLLSLAVVGGCDSMMHHDSDHAIKSEVKDDNTPPGSKMSTTMPAAGVGKPEVPIKDANNVMPVATKKFAVANINSSKAATTQPSNNNVSGRVTFAEAEGKVTITAEITGLSPGKHGFHIHEKPDLTGADLMSTGGHFDPAGTHHHGDPNGMETMKHAGDLGNLVADENGKAHLVLTVNDLTIDGPGNGIVGHSVIIHAGTDDLTSNPAGKSGARVAGGVIEKAASE